MKKLIASLILSLLLAPATFGQSVGASQIKKKANAGLVADSANALAIGIYRGTTAPASPVSGQLWQDTTTTAAVLKYWNGSAWEVNPGAAITTQATLATLPGSPYNGQIIWISGQHRAIVYDSATSKWYYLDAYNRPAQADYSIDTAGYGSTFIGAAGATSGTVVTGGAMTIGDHSCAVTYYSLTGGENVPGTAFVGTALTAGTMKTFNLTFAASTTGSYGKRIYCSKANTTVPLFLIASYDDTTTTAHAVTVADTSFGTVTAPDVDFSAPIPSPWVFYEPDRSFGGCGSTGTSLLCSALKLTVNSATAVGVRLAYTISGSPAAWRASWTINRIDVGFPGNTTVGNAKVFLAAMFATYSDVAPITLGIAVGMATTVPAVPFSTTLTPNVGPITRAFNGAYSYASAANANPWPPFTTTPVYVAVVGRLDGVDHSYRAGASGNQVDFVTFPYTVTQVASSIPCLSGSWFCTNTDAINYVGIDLASPNNAGGSEIYELSGFHWWSE